MKIGLTLIEFNGNWNELPKNKILLGLGLGTNSDIIDNWFIFNYNDFNKYF